MRKNIKNNMITRILAIGLATAVFATSAPASVFADDEETVTVESSDSSSDSSSESSSDSSSESSSDSNESVSCESEAPATEAAPEVAEAAPEVAPEVAEAAAEDGTVVVEVLVMESEVAPEVTEVVPETTSEAVSEVVAEDTEVSEAGEKSLVEIASESLDNFEDKNETVKSTEQKSSDEADSAVENAEVANTSKSKKEAYQAKDDAIADITASEEDLEKVNAAYEEAVVAKEQAEADVAAAEAEYNAAVERLSEAKKTASQNLTAAQAQKNDAESRVRTAESAIKAAEENKAKLEKIEEEYRKLMVHYYRNDFDKNLEIDVYNPDDNTLNFTESANKAKENNGKAITGKMQENTMKIARELMKELIEYKVGAKDGYVDGSIKIGVKEEGMVEKDQKKIANEGEWAIDPKTKEQKVSVDNTPNEEIWFTDYQGGNKNNGRGHSVKVTYEVKTVGEDGKETTQTITEYYNYIIKGSHPNDKKDVENGPIFLAQIDRNKDINDETRVKRDDDPNNYDDYTKLTQKIADLKKEIIDNKAALDQASDDVKTAEAKVSQYTQELRQLENTRIDDSKVKELKERLAEAVEDLGEAEEAKEALEVQVEEARKIVDAIDLSRFNRNDESSYEESSDDTDPVVLVYTIPTIEDIPEIIPTISSVLPTVIPSLPTSGVLGVRVVADAGSDNVVSDVTKKPVAVKEINLGGDVIGKENGKKLVKIDNNIVPLAAAPGVVEANGFNWWWILLLVGTAVVIFVVVYKKRKEEDEAKAVNK